jgi:hypothetical protein
MGHHALRQRRVVRDPVARTRKNGLRIDAGRPASWLKE